MPFARFLVSLTACALLGACSQLSPYSDLTKLDLTLNASDQLNPDLNGRPSPLVLQLVELSHATAFEQADYFDLQQRPAAMLAPDLLAMEEMELRPGEQRHFKIAAGAEAKHLGLIAAYRDLPNTRWRIRLDVQPGARNQFTLALDEHGISQRHTTGEP